MVYLTRQQVREVDRLATDRYGIPGIVLMENAARAATNTALRMLPEPRGSEVLILCGGGNNGGDGLAVARHLHNAGCNVCVALVIDPQRYKGDAQVNWKIVEAMGLRVSEASEDVVTGRRWELIVDAIFGTGLDQQPREPLGRLARAVNMAGRPALAIDLPSGMDCDTGTSLGACIRATRTITFAAPKAGFANPAAKEYLGIVEVGDIGCPRELLEQVAQENER